MNEPMSRAQLYTYVNDQPILLSLLYNLNLLPEQVKDGSKEEYQMEQIVAHFVAHRNSNAADAAIAPLVEELRAAAHTEEGTVYPDERAANIAKSHVARQQQAANALLDVMAQMNEMTKQLARTKDLYQGAKATLLEQSSHMAGLRAVTGSPCSQW